MSRRKAYYAKKIKRAVHLLFYRKHRKPGVKGWELRKAVGSDYPKVLSVLDKYLKNLDLKVTTVFETDQPPEQPSLNQLNRARFCITLRGELTPKESKMLGWRIDDIAGLAAAITYIMSKRGKAPRKEVEDLLREKIPGWKVDLNINRYIRYGYLAEDEHDELYLDWRTSMEVDQRSLIDLVLKSEA